MQKVYNFLIFLVVAAMIILGLIYRNQKQTDILHRRIKTPKTKVRRLDNNIKKKLPSKKIQMNIKKTLDKKLIAQVNSDLEQITRALKSDAKLAHNPAPIFEQAAFMISAISKKDIVTQHKFYQTCKNNQKLSNSLRFICGEKLNKLAI